MAEKKKKPLMTLKESLTPKDFEVPEEYKDFIESSGAKTVSLIDLLESEEEIPYVTMDNIGVIMDQLSHELGEEEATWRDPVIFEHKSLDGQKSKWRNKVFVTGASDDMKKYLDDISNKVISNNSSDIFYYEKELTQNQLHDFDLLFSQMNFVVLLVSPKLFSDECRALSVDLDIAQTYGIPVLPVLIDRDAIDTYNDKIGKYELLDLFSKEFNSKLSSFLGTSKINGIVVNNVKKAFPRQLFLSYRKKDYKLAVQFLNKIRDNPSFADVAIWYDDYLVPGEDFNNEIHDAIVDADAVILLVTRHILGKDNYVYKVEYPLAKKAKKKPPIIPVLADEAKDFDVSSVKIEYTDIGDIYSDDEAISVLEKVLPKAPELTADQEYYIGISYLHGIVSEKNIELASKFLLDSARKEYIMAVATMWNIIHSSFHAKTNVDSLISISEKLLQTCLLEFQNGDFRNIQPFWEICDSLQSQYYSYGDRVSSLRIVQLMYDYAEYVSVRKADKQAKLARAYFRNALVLGHEDPKQALQYIGKAKEIIDELKDVAPADFPKDLYISIHTAALQIYQGNNNIQSALDEGMLLEQYTVETNADSSIADKHVFINFANEYLKILGSADFEHFEQLVERERSIIASLPADAFTTTIKSTFYSVVGFVYHEIKKDFQKSLNCFRMVYETAKEMDSSLQPQASYFALAKSCIDLATCYMELENYTEAQKYYSETQNICNEKKFPQKYWIHREAVHRHANMLIMHLNQPYEAMMMYHNFLGYIAENDIDDERVLFDIPEFNYRIAYILGNYLGNRDAQLDFLKNAKEFIEVISKEYQMEIEGGLRDLYERIQSDMQ